MSILFLPDKLAHSCFELSVRIRIILVLTHPESTDDFISMFIQSRSTLKFDNQLARSSIVESQIKARAIVVDSVLRQIEPVCSFVSTS